MEWRFPKTQENEVHTVTICSNSISFEVFFHRLVCSVLDCYCYLFVSDLWCEIHRCRLVCCRVQIEKLLACLALSTGPRKREFSMWRWLRIGRWRWRVDRDCSNKHRNSQLPRPKSMWLDSSQTLLTTRRLLSYLVYDETNVAQAGNQKHQSRWRVHGVQKCSENHQLQIDECCTAVDNDHHAKWMAARNAHIRIGQTAFGARFGQWCPLQAFLQQRMQVFRPNHIIDGRRCGYFGGIHRWWWLDRFIRMTTCSGCFAILYFQCIGSLWFSVWSAGEFFLTNRKSGDEQRNRWVFEPHMKRWRLRFYVWWNIPRTWRRFRWIWWWHPANTAPPHSTFQMRVMEAAKMLSGECSAIWWWAIRRVASKTLSTVLNL